MPCSFGLAQARVPAKKWSVRADLCGRLEVARQLIERRFDEPLSTRELAEAACLSPYHFIRLFRAAYGLAPMQYRARLRMRRAEELLAKGHRVGWVATAVGRESLSSFSRDFQRRSGRQPSRFRNRG